MKKFKITGVIFAIVIVLSSCSNNRAKKPEQIGKQVFEILKNFNNTSPKEYQEYFMTEDERHEIADNVAKTKEERRTLIRIKQHIKRNEVYDKLKMVTDKEHIDWKKIEYSDFEYDIDEEDGLEACFGNLSFKYDNEPYSVRFESVYNGKGYVLAEIFINGLLRDIQEK